jgi:hypothetical protein
VWQTAIHLSTTSFHNLRECDHVTVYVICWYNMDTPRTIFCVIIILRLLILLRSAPCVWKISLIRCVKKMFFLSNRGRGGGHGQSFRSILKSPERSSCHLYNTDVGLAGKINLFISFLIRSFFFSESSSAFATSSPSFPSPCSLRLIFHLLSFAPTLLH